MSEAGLTWRRLCTGAAEVVRGVTALIAPDGGASIRKRWIFLCLSANKRFPGNVIFTRKYELEEAEMTAYAIIKRRSSEPPVPPETCDRCGARALWKIIIPRSDSAGEPVNLFLCGHHREEHAPHIASRGYAEERLPAPVMRG